MPALLIHRLKQRWQRWWAARHPLSDSHLMGQRNIYILPSHPGLAFCATLGLLLLAIAGLLVALLRFVFTGRKPVAFTAFTQFRQASQAFRRGGQPGFGGFAPRGEPSAGAATGVTDVVDVQAREVGTSPGAQQPNHVPLPLMHEPKS